MWTIRVCDCGCVHDFPDTGCPSCGSHARKTYEVVPASRLSLAEKGAEKNLDQALEHLARAESLATENERLKARLELQTNTILAYQRYTGIVDVEELREASDEEGGT